LISASSAILGVDERGPTDRGSPIFLAVGIPHQLLAANLPCLPGSKALNSFVLPSQEVERQ